MTAATLGDLDPGPAGPGVDRERIGPSAGAVRPVRVVVRMRRSLALAGVGGFAPAAVLGAALGWQRGAPDLACAAVALACFAAGHAWYLGYPVGLYEPRSGTYVHLWPFGIAARRYPTTASRSRLVLRGNWIVTCRRPWWPVLTRRSLEPGDWRMVAAAVRRGPERPWRPADLAARPGFIRTRHRVCGLALAVVAAASTAAALAGAVLA